MPTISSFNWEKGFWTADTTAVHSKNATAKIKMIIIREKVCKEAWVDTVTLPLYRFIILLTKRRVTIRKMMYRIKMSNI